MSTLVRSSGVTWEAIKITELRQKLELESFKKFVHMGKLEWCYSGGFLNAKIIFRGEQRNLYSHSYLLRHPILGFKVLTSPPTIEDVTNANSEENKLLVEILDHEDKIYELYKFIDNENGEQDCESDISIAYKENELIVRQNLCANLLQQLEYTLRP